GIKPQIVGMSHHLGRWRLTDDAGVNPGMSNLVTLDEEGAEHRLSVKQGAKPCKTFDPDTERVWWQDVGVHQNLTHAVQPDPISGAHCWLQKVRVRKARPDERFGDVYVDTRRSMEVYRSWVALTRSSVDTSPDGTRRPRWLKRPLKPNPQAYALPSKPFGRD
ncbi:MAG: formate dehydrogenase, partial [Myxococcota bacterium]